MSWVVVPALEALRREFNEVFPARDRTSDGGIGDTSHTARPSGHNPDESGVPEDHDADSVDEVRARDIDADLRHPTVSMEDVCRYLVRECRAGRIAWIKYLIFGGRIWRASAGWAEEPYTGVNRHDHHLHISCKPDAASETTTRPVGLATLLEDGVSQADVINALKSAEGRRLIAEAVFNTDDVVPAPTAPLPGKNPDGSAVNTHWGAGAYARHTYNAAVAARDYAAQCKALASATQAAVATLVGRDFVNEAEIAQAVLGGLDASKIAQAIPPTIAQDVVDLLTARLAS